MAMSNAEKQRRFRVREKIRRRMRSLMKEICDLRFEIVHLQSREKFLLDQYLDFNLEVQNGVSSEEDESEG